MPSICKVRFKCLCACDFPCHRMLWLLKMFLGTGRTWGEKRSVLIFEGATPTFCFSIFEQSFFRSVSSMLIWMWIIEMFQQFSFMKLSRFLPNFRGIRPLPSLYFSLSLTCKKLSMNIYIYICVDMYRYPLMHTCINIYIYSNIYIYFTYILLLSLSLWFGMKVAGVLVLANVTIKGANFWGLERRKNVVPIRSTFKVCAQNFNLEATFTQTASAAGILNWGGPYLLL